MRDGHVGYDGVFGIPPVTVTVMRNVCKFVSSALRMTVGDGYFWIPRNCHPTGEHPANAKCRRGIHPPFSACKTTPAVRKIHLIFPTAFTGCNTLHFALQSRVPDVPSGLP